MPPLNNKGIENAISLLKVDIQRDIQREIREHLHDGNMAQQVNYFDLFDLPVQYLQFEVFGASVNTATGNGKYYLHIHKGLDGLNLVEIHALVAVAGITGTLTIQIANVTDSVDMLSTAITIDTTEVGSDTAATPLVINSSNDEVQENDVLRIDIDGVHSGTAAKGLYITLGFK